MISSIIMPGLDIVPVPHTSATTSPAICRYGDYLEGVYSRSSVSSDGKFPPTPSKTYVNLAVVEQASQICDIEDMRKNTLQGQVDEMLKKKKKIKITDILKSQNNVSLVFVEGPPGIGKSTLAWELCRRWDRNQYDLAVLLRLREREVQQIESIADFFPHGDKKLQQSVTEEVLDVEGKGVLIILDGYDELPIKLRCQGLLLKLLKGEVLPKCSVLVTSRPSATSDLFEACSPQIQKHVEILGFTQECVKDYASSVFSSEPEMLDDFLTYISASKNPAINSLMYIPLNAAIIVCIYRNSRKKGCPIPKTMTQVYTQLCLTLLQRYIKSKAPENKTTLNKFSDISTPYSTHFERLSQIAFEQYEQENLIFYSDTVSEELISLGFLDSVAPLHSGGETSYNFLHLTLQEFLAAYHITQLPNGIDVFKRHSEDRRWEVVWRFVSGLTEFQYFTDSVRCDAFVSESEDDEYLEIKPLLLHCLFEGQLKFDHMAVLGVNKIYSCQSGYLAQASSPLDRYALGYCISNCSTTTSWKVKIHGGSGESFIWGLNSNHYENGVISQLTMDGVDPYWIDSFPSKFSAGINNLTVVESGDKHMMKNTTSHSADSKLIAVSLEDIFRLATPGPLDLSLIVWHGHGLLSNQSFLSFLRGLVDSPSSNLKDLTIKKSEGGEDAIIETLCDILFGPSSLNQLTLELPHFTKSSFNLLETNTCLTTVNITNKNYHPPLQALAKILQNNKTIEKLQWGWYSFCGMNDSELYAVDELVQHMNKALSTNTTLLELTLEFTDDSYSILSSSLLQADRRVKCEDVFASLNYLIYPQEDSDYGDYEYDPSTSP